MRSDNRAEDASESDDTSRVEESPTEPAAPTPGQFLREQRELKGLGVQEVAEQLHLTRHYVKALESDNYDKLPGEVFAKGYIRSYARLLGLDPDDVLSLYQQLGERKQARKQEAIKRHARRRLDRNRPWIIVSGVAFVALAVLLWYLNAGMAESGESSAAEAFGQNQLTGGSTVSADEVPALTQSVEQSDFVQNNDGLRFLELDWGGDDNVSVTVHGDSWVEVADRHDVGFFRDRLEGGEQLRITGTAPFSILLSNARQIELRFNGRVVDVSASARSDDTARLTLGL
jgi:cytoskeleton protein RodZ